VPGGHRGGGPGHPFFACFWRGPGIGPERRNRAPRRSFVQIIRVHRKRGEIFSVGGTGAGLKTGKGAPGFFVMGPVRESPRVGVERGGKIFFFGRGKPIGRFLTEKLPYSGPPHWEGGAKR